MAPAHSSPDGDDLDRAVTVPEHVVLREFPNETVVLNLDSGKYFSLNPPGGRMAHALMGSGSLRAAANELERQFPEAAADTIRGDLLRFCEQLEEKGLIEVAEEA